MLCPYCQTNIKNKTEAVYCEICNTPHHKDCYQENGGCTTYGCRKNPNFSDVLNYEPQMSDVPDTAMDVGHLTVTDLKDLLNKPCINCNTQIDKNFDICPYCNKSQSEKETKSGFDDELKRKYREKVIEKRKKIIPAVISITILSILLGIVLFSTLKYFNGYFNSEEYKIRIFINDWRKSLESKDIESYKTFLDKDYVYIPKSGTEIKRDERIKKIDNLFKSANSINIKFSDIKVLVDTIDVEYANVSFKYDFTTIKLPNKEKSTETSNKTLRLFRSKDTGFEWKIFREYTN